VGQVWFLATRTAEKHVLAIHHLFQPVLKDMHARFPVLLAYTHPRNRRAPPLDGAERLRLSHRIRSRAGGPPLLGLPYTGDLGPICASH
jgi:hypothetical protein